MQQHVKILGALHIAFGALGLLGALAVLAIFGGLVGFLQFQPGVQDTPAIPVLGIVGTFVTGLILITSLPSLIAGIGLLNYQNWARLLTIILSAIGIFNVPFGTALGVYGFWVLLSDEGTRLFTSRPAAPVFGIR
jgi:uncharacterized membrane protein (UPF0136 family)